MSNELSSDLLTRREMLTRMGVLGAGVMAAQMGLVDRAQAADAEPIRYALIGCGARGDHAAENVIEAGKIVGCKVEILAVADFFAEKAEALGKKFNVPAERCFAGPAAYRKVLALPIDVVLLATPPIFRPLHVEAAIEAGKNVFMEKPAAVDPPGVRRIIAAGEAAKKKGLSVVAGTQRRHQGNYLRCKSALDKGAIGKLVGGQVFWCGGPMKVREREAGESDASYMIHNWYNFAQMSGDHINEQNVHNLDVANWFIGRHPVQANGFGGRARRHTGTQYDFFSVDLDYGDDLHIQAMCRQIKGCYQRVDEFFIGTDGTAYGSGKIQSSKIDSMNLPEIPTHQNGQVQEQVDLLLSIIKKQPLAEAQNVAESTLTAIMGRISAYTGQPVRWVDLMENSNSPLYNMTLGVAPEDFEKGTVVAPKDDVIPLPGEPA